MSSFDRAALPTMAEQGSSMASLKLGVPVTGRRIYWVRGVLHSKDSQVPNTTLLRVRPMDTISTKTGGVQ